MWCSHGLVMKDKSKSVYDGNNVGKSNVKKEHMKQSKQCDKQVKGIWSMISKKKKLVMTKNLCDMKFRMKKSDHRRTVSSRALNVNQRCTMKIFVFLSLEDRWHLSKKSNLEHSFHAKLDNTA